MARFEHRNDKRCAICGAYWTECKHSNADVENFVRQSLDAKSKVFRKSVKLVVNEMLNDISKDIESIKQEIAEIKEEIRNTNERLRRTL